MESDTAFRRHHAIITGIGYFLDGYNITVIAVFTYILATYHIFPYSSLGIGLASGSALLGAGIGSWVFGHYSDRFGRRHLFLAYLSPFVLIPIFIAFSQNVAEVIILRAILGVSIGADYAIGPVYSMEMSNEMDRGRMSGFIWAFWSLGASLAFMIGFLSLTFLGTVAWRISFGVVALPAMILLVLKLRLPESNRWLNADNIKRSDSGNADGAFRRKQNKPTGMGVLFRGDLGKRTAIVWIPWILLDVGSYGFGLYGPIIIGSLGFRGANSFLLTSLFYTVGFMFAIASTKWNDRFGRKVTQAFGFGFMGIGLGLLVLTSFSMGAVAIILSFSGLALWYGMENMGPANTLKLYAVELFPTRLRSTSMGAATSVTRFVSFLSAFEFPFLVEYIGERGFFIFLIVFMVSALLFTLGAVPETKGLTLDEISVSRYRRGKFNR